MERFNYPVIMYIQYRYISLKGGQKNYEKNH